MEKELAVLSNHLQGAGDHLQQAIKRYAEIKQKVDELSAYTYQIKELVTPKENQ